MFSIFNASVAGSRHIKNKADNQDAVFSDVQSGVTFIALADGAGSLKGAGICAENVVRQVSARIADNFGSLVNMDNTQAAAEISGYIQECMKSLSESSGLPEMQLGSTFLFAGSDGKDFLIVHLGDGAILSKNDKGVCGVISVPEGSADGKSTFLTCSHNLTEHIRIKKAPDQELCEVILLSDGMLSAAFEDGFMPRYDTGSSYQQLLEMAVMDNNDDDSSYIIMRKKYDEQ